MKCIRGKYIPRTSTTLQIYTFIWVHVHSYTFAVVPTDVALHQCLRSILYSLFLFFVGTGSSTRRIMSILLLAIVFFPGDLVHVHYCKFTVVPTNIGKYHVYVKHTTVRLLHCCFYVLVHNRLTLTCMFFVSICTKFGALIRPSDFTNPTPPT